MRLSVIANSLGYDRFIVIPARKFGNSVERNRIRRQMKEIFRLYDGRLMPQSEHSAIGHDFALVVYPGKLSSHSLLESDFLSLLDRVAGK